MELRLVEDKHGWWVVDHRNDEYGPFRTQTEAEAERARVREFYGTYENDSLRPMGTPSDR